MSLLLERYKMEFEKYKITLDQAMSLGRFYIGTTLVLLGGVLLKRASDQQLTDQQLTRPAPDADAVKLLALLAAIFSVQVMVMMVGILKSRKKSLVNLDNLWRSLKAGPEWEIASEFASHFAFGRNRLYATFLAFAVYPLIILIISVVFLVQ